MNLRSLVVTSLALSIGFTTARAQTQEASSEAITRPRTVTARAQRSPQTPSTTSGSTIPKVESTRPSQPAPQPTGAKDTTTARPQSIELAGTEPEINESTAALQQLTPQLIHARIAEAERLFKSRPLPTAMSPSTEFVILAALDHRTSRIHQVTLAKETFLTKGAEVTMTSSLGFPLSIRIVRANGVNTAVTIFDSAGHSLVPLLVEFPIEKGGVFREMAYYTSAHPALLSPQLASAGRGYITTMIDLAAKRLREKGVFISPQITEVANRLCLVEHIDHERFRLENRSALFQEVYSLYALNQSDTYRYSVSFAGAGGMVQMIPWAYNLMRQRHPGVGLIPDFVVGMRNHANALQAMLLYMQDTWNDLSANEDVQYALSAKLATQAELLAAGYNSNAARLPLYIRRGNASWRTLIPRETQVYLQIYKNIEALLPTKSQSVGATPIVD
jgi:hypothetical protein